MLQKKISKVLLVGAGLVLTGCGDGSGSGVSDTIQNESDQKVDRSEGLEQKPTIETKVQLDASLNNLAPAFLSGSFSKADINLLGNAIQSQESAQLVRTVNKAIADLKSALATSGQIKAAIPKIVNSPIVGSVVIPFIASIISDSASEIINDPKNRSSKQFKGNVEFLGTVQYTQREGFNGDLYALKYDRRNIFVNLIDEDDVSLSIQEVAALDFDKKDPKVFKQSVESELKTIKPELIRFINENPKELVEGIFAIINKIEDVDETDIDKFRKVMPSLTAMLSEGEPSVDSFRKFMSDLNVVPSERALSSEMPTSSLGSLLYRQARKALPGVDLQKLTVDGQRMDQTNDVRLPVHIQLKGNVNTVSRSGNISGSVAYNLNGTVFGLAQALGNVQDQHYETSLIISQSYSNFFAEVQMGVVGMRENLFSGWEGQRYQATLGYDAVLVSPFVQLEYRPLSNGFSTLDATAMYVGLESDVVTVKLTESKFTSSVIAKVGYESTHQAMFGQSLKPNQGGAAFVEWNGALTLSSGLELKSVLTLGSNDQSVKLNVTLEQ